MGYTTPMVDETSVAPPAGENLISLVSNGASIDAGIIQTGQIFQCYYICVFFMQEINKSIH